ncbi:hypothetical protein Vadar_020913 [Vaccinium darrowii]|uniref:Uncharacterized protein n=1 Tax=Vaccinium darrowii TaxID=229202 RepID=A0ACB7XIX0_9ERIC|nr:hypothetical protein Vadar_020913 [Vaccinium darrowii]
MTFTIFSPTITNKTTVNRSVAIILSPPFKNQTESKNITTKLPPPSSFKKKKKLPPRSIAEDEDDKPLLRRASRVNPDSGSPRKLAFMFLTTSPLPFAPLWELYFNQTPQNIRLFNIYVHADPRFQYNPSFSGVFENRVISGSKPARRASPSLISAARRLLSHALLHDPSNYMFALLSPSCIPLHSFNYTYDTLMRSNKSFIQISKSQTGAHDRWAARGKHAMLPEVPFGIFRKGSQFFVLTRKHARMVVSDTRLWSKFKLPCLRKSSCYPEEHYFPTLLNMGDQRGCVPATLTHVDWRRSHGGHPRTYKASEIGRELILALRRGRPRYGSDSRVIKRRDPFLFARKFSLDSIEPLMRLATDVIFKD